MPGARRAHARIQRAWACAGGYWAGQPSPRARLGPLLVASLVLSCSADQSLSNGTPCSADSACASRFCETGPWRPARCAAPDVDVDGDGLDAVAERAAGTNPASRDSDNDGLDDKLEVGPNPATPRDRDGDGKPDALEHDTHDEDGDCLADPDDKVDSVPASKEALAAAFCDLGVCAGHSPRATCLGAVGKVKCEVLGVPDYEPDGELRCDRLDNDCDGKTDEDLDGKAGEVCGVSGVCLGAPTSRCVAGQWVCNLGGIDNYETVEKSCDGVDNDCDGKTDEAPICDDAVPCTVDACVAGTGCEHVPTAKRCNDGNPCTVDLCELPGGCRSLPHIGTCDDGDPCTTGESCAKGVCKGGTAAICDDGNPCTLDPCAADKGCLSVALPVGSACKPTDLCAQAGTCLDGGCKGHSTVVCDDGSPCTSDDCDSASGACVHAAHDGVCNDGNPCTTKDTCFAKLCIGIPLPSCCTADGNCDDGNPCTADLCQGGACKNAGVGSAACSDGNPCTIGESCDLGLCTGGLWQACNDKDLCTLDICDVVAGTAKCSHPVLPEGANCDDGDVCNGFSACANDGCVVGVPLKCEDTNPCTLDSCNPLKGCAHTSHSGSCDDGNACTLSDGCASGSCVGTALQCDDLNVCTIDTCKVELGCRYLPTSGLCSDGDACTTADSCSGGGCSGTPKNCDDKQPCTVDSCDGTGACVHSSEKTEKTGCDDGDACTLGDICTGGSCQAGVSINCDDGNTCTDDSCDLTSGLCKITFHTGPCVTPTGCTSDAVCEQGLCKGKAISNCCKLNGDCNDFNPCTLDGCAKPEGSCSHKAVSGVSCSDGSQCTVGDACASGLCKGAAYLGCDDSKPCTLDYCLPTSGCQHLVTVTGSCADGDPCNGDELCGVGGCAAGTAPDCDDGKFCTLDLCDKGKGCANAFKQPGTACDDGSTCTTTDVCDGLGSCKGTPTTGPTCCVADIDCDDGFACTQDSCVIASAQCKHTPLVCTPGQSCTAGWCETGTCKAASRCLVPQAFDESFEATTAPGWRMLADAPPVSAGATWASQVDAVASDGTRSLHCPLASGTYEARFPPLALSAGAWRVRLKARLDKDGVVCSEGALRVKREGQVLAGGTLCGSTATMVALDLPFDVTLDGDVVQLSAVWVGVAAAPVATRGVWIDEIRITAEPKGIGCACSP